ncbi:MAG: adenylate/guanylate cyclase domain-containing protein [Actinomycetia bacterium]|nr:adenylate/guanylate cyclase domain-containing protein [Actinomycetes bacterium]
MTSGYRPPAQIGGGRVRRAFAFVDLSGFTAYNNTHGDDEAVAVLGEFRRIVREVCSARGVRVAKWLGDGCMLVGIETGVVIEAVLDMIDRLHETVGALPVKAGVSEGAVILFEGDDHIGKAVNLASRLCDHANPGQVLAHQSLAPSGVGLDPILLDLQGYDQPVPAIDIRRAARA